MAYGALIDVLFENFAHRVNNSAGKQPEVSAMATMDGAKSSKLVS